MAAMTSVPASTAFGLREASMRATVAADAAVMWPEGNEKPSSGAAPANRHQSR